MSVKRRPLQSTLHGWHSEAYVIALCLGWDVGGWHGARDGLAALVLRRDGHLQRVGRVTRCGLGDIIARGELTLSEVAARVQVEPLLTTAPRIVIGVDAPLAFPQGFVKAAVRPVRSVPDLGGLLPKFIDNPLAFRDTDRHTAKAFRSPLSPALSWLANNTTKARAGCAQLRRGHPSARVIPFESDRARVAVIEVYPSLWRQLASRRGRVPTLVHTFRRLQNKHEQDAGLCAISAACYEATRLGVGARLLPRVCMHPNHGTARVEGWIFAPDSLLRGSRR